MKWVHWYSVPNRSGTSSTHGVDGVKKQRIEGRIRQGIERGEEGDGRSTHDSLC